MIKVSLDKNKPYGEIFGVSALGAKYVQDEVEFSADFKRVTPITARERAAHAAEKQAYADLIAAESQEAEAREELRDATIADNTEASDAAVAEAHADMPDFSSFSKIKMIQYGKKYFPALKLNMNMTHEAIRLKLEGRF